APFQKELAIGALAPNGVNYIDHQLVSRLNINEDYLYSEIKRKTAEIKEQEKKFGIPLFNQRVINRIILIDDGIATGATVLAAIKYLKSQIPSALEGGSKELIKIILVTPVIATDVHKLIQSEVDSIIALEISNDFVAVGQFYREFDQASDETVINILKKNKKQ
ncbi:hypothetical protein A2Y99_04190, partial [Candidatus Gottesmanbacteria bacterium RBG_13_37_7]